MPDYHKMGKSEILKLFTTSEKGLSDAEASKRLKKYGRNELVSKKKINPLKIFLAQFKSFLILILIAAALISFFIESVLDTVVIVTIIVINALIGFRQEYKAEKAMEALKRLASPKAIVIRSGKKQEIETSCIVPGDIICLEEGTKIPADMRLIKIVELKVDEAALTGESVPVGKHFEVVSKKAVLGERKNMAYMGTAVTYGRGVGVVVSTGMDTEMGKIAKMIEDVEEKETPLQKKLNSFGKKLGFIILIICAVVTVLGILRGIAPLQMFMTGVALAVAAVPEGLPAIVTITLAFGMMRMARSKAIVRRLSAVETLGSVTYICSDKTGTLTRNEMIINEIFVDDKIIEVKGEGYEPKGGFNVNGKPIDILKNETMRTLLECGQLCNNAELNKKGSAWSILGDPTEGALVVLARKAGLGEKHFSKFKRLKEVPFSSERKMMSVVCSYGGKKFVYSKGAPEILLKKCTRIMKGNRAARISEKDKKSILDASSKMSKKALRALAIAFREGGEIGSEKGIESNLVMLGVVGMMDLPRSGVKEDIQLCTHAGIKCVMVTGDHSETAVAIADKIGLLKKDSKVLTGEELERMSSADLAKIVQNVVVYARVNPSQKVKIVEALKKKGHVIAMTGDGVNDAPALKKADIGISMGIKGTDVAKEASDMVLEDDHFSTIVRAVKEGRHIYDNIVKFILYLLSSNTGEVLTVFIAMLLHWPLPVIAVQLIWINLVTDGLPATALGAEPVTEGIMKRKPRSKKEAILGNEFISFLLIVGVIMAVGTLYLFSSSLSRGYEYALTMSFTTLVVFQMFNVINSKSMRESMLSRKLFTNYKLWIAIMISLLLQIAVIYIGPLQPLFRTVPLGLEEWIKILVISSSVLFIIEIKKYITRRRFGE